MTQKQITEAQKEELELYKRCFESILSDKEYGDWRDLSDEDRKDMILEIDGMADEMMAPKDRFFKLAYTLKDDRVEIMAIPKELATTHDE